jgi:uncharacterized protein (DUF58 family)
VALLALAAVVLTGHVALVLLAAPALGALALMPSRRPAGELAVDVALSGSRCFEGEDVTITATVRGQLADGGPLEEVTVQLELAPQVTLAGDPALGLRTFLPDGADPVLSARWTVRPGRWGRYSPGAVLVSGRAGRGGFGRSVRVELDQLEIFPRAERMRPRLVPPELLRRIGEHTGRAVGDGVEFVGLRPYQPGDQLRDVNRAVSIRRGQLHVNRRAAARAADLVVMIDSLDEPGPVAERTLDAAVHGSAALVTAYLRVADRAGIVVLGGALRWLGPAHGMRQFYRIAEMMLHARCGTSRRSAVVRPKPAGTAWRCGCGGWTGPRPGPRSATSACRCCAGTPVQNSTACSPRSASPRPASAARWPAWPAPPRPPDEPPPPLDEPARIPRTSQAPHLPRKPHGSPPTCWPCRPCDAASRGLGPLT